ncbi:hypothetical protein OFN63_34320, partial [Escherichia coli]|nr:hypothetical protein [Escherichia coli]
MTGDAFQQAQKEYDNYKEALQQGLNVLRQVNGNQDLTLEKFLQQKVLLKELNPISNDFISSLSSTSQGQKQLADDVQRGTNE